MDENQLTVAAFAKMAKGEAVSLADAQRVWKIILSNGMRIDTQDESARNKFLSELKATLSQLFFS